MKGAKRQSNIERDHGKDKEKEREGETERVMTNKRGRDRKIERK